MLKKILPVLILLIAIAGYFGYDKYQQIFAPNVPSKLQNEFLHIPTGSSFEDLVNILKTEDFIIDEASFVWVAERMKYKKDEVRAGRYQIKPDWSNRSLISHLRGGKQATVKVILNNERLPEDVANKISEVIEADEIDILELLQSKSVFRTVRFEARDCHDCLHSEHL